MENEIPAATGVIEIIDLVGSPMMELRRRVASLLDPDRDRVYRYLFRRARTPLFAGRSARTLCGRGQMLPLWVPLKPLLGVDRSGGCDDPDHDWTGGCAASASHPRDRLRIVGVRWRPGPSLDPGFGARNSTRPVGTVLYHKKQSMGMGLCIARTIIESCGGTLSAEGRPSGAVFHVRLPRTA